MSPSEPDQSLGEVARRLDDVFRRYEQIANDLPKMFVSRELYEAYKELAKTQHEVFQTQLDTVSKRVSDLEDDKKWLYRLIIGAVILALVGLVVGVSRVVSTSTSKTALDTTVVMVVTRE